MSATLGKQAVVVGGGMGGLFAARVLSDHFENVLVLERDEEPLTDKPRGSVPQGHHFHVLLPGGMDAMVPADRPRPDGTLSELTSGPGPASSATNA
jgi:2-polyprenyl-6-methoxyphenol hydroxylase-like FAD-dependent oxidoreductase